MPYTFNPFTGNFDYYAVGGTVAAGQIAFGSAANTIAGDSNLLWDNTNKRLGIGITPLVKLHQSGTNTGSAYTDLGGTGRSVSVAVSNTLTDDTFTSTYSPLYAETLLNFSVNPGAKAVNGITGQLFITSGATSLASMTVRAAQQAITYSGSSTLGTATAAPSTVMNSSTGTISSATATQGAITNSNASGVITDAYFLRASTITNAGTITNTYGVHVGDITAGTQTNVFSFYGSDYGTRNFFAGSPTEFGFTGAWASGNGLITLAATNNPTQGTGKNTSSIVISAGVDTSGTPSYYGTSIVQFRLNQATSGEKQLTEMGIEGTWNNSSVLGTTTHWYVWDPVNTRTILSHRYTANSALNVSDLGLQVMGVSDASVIESTQKALTKNDSTTATYFSALLQPTFNTGASNANTTFNVLAIDTTNTAVTGLTTYLVNAAYGGTGRFRIDSTGTTMVSRNTSAFTVPIGNSNPDTLTLVGKDGENTWLGIETFGSAVFPQLWFRRGLGTAASMTALTSGLVVGVVGFQPGYTAAFTAQPTARMYAQTTETISSTAWGTKLLFDTTAAGGSSAALTTRLVIDESGLAVTGDVSITKEGATGSASRMLSAQVGSSDTITASTVGTTETAFATKYTSIPANMIVANKVLRVTTVWQVTSTASPTLKLRMKLGGTTVFSSSAVAPASGTNDGFGNTLVIQGTAAAGASVNVETGQASSSFITSNGNIYNFTAQPVALATNGALELTWTAEWSANTAGNSVTLRQLIVEEAN